MPNRLLWEDITPKIISANRKILLYENQKVCILGAIPARQRGGRVVTDVEAGGDGHLGRI